MSDDEQPIRELAYQIWQSEGCPEGQHHRHWEMACRLVETGHQPPAAPAEATPARPARRTRSAKPAPVAAVAETGEPAKSPAKKPRSPRKPPKGA